MKCQVCQASFSDQDKCPQCGNGPFSSGDSQGILRARQEFMDKASAYAPEARVSTWDKYRPWLGVVIGFVIFMLWLRACSTMGWKIF